MKIDFKKEFKEWAIALLEAGVVLAILFFVFWPMRVEGPSMENTFFTGDRVAISRILTAVQGLEKEDVVVCSYDDNGKDKLIIKRLIAKEGDSVSIHDGEVFVNEKKLDEPYILGKTYGELDLIVPEDNIFVLGDNRPVSKDSRMIGCVPMSNLKGKVVLRWFPFNSIKTF